MMNHAIASNALTILVFSICLAFIPLQKLNSSSNFKKIYNSNESNLLLVDSDGDGIDDSLDLDDDNDGILDKNETSCSSSISDFSFYGDAVQTVSNNSIVFTANNAWRTSYSNEIISLPINIEFQADNSLHRMIGVLPIGANETISNWNDGAYKIYMQQNGQLLGKLPAGWDIHIQDYNNKRIEFNIDISGRLTLTLDNILLYSKLIPTTDFQLAISSYNGGSINDIFLTHSQDPCNTQDLDTDNDQIPNRLDLDSDNDGCVDAFEASAGFTLNDMDGNGRLLGGVDSNQSSLSYGVPLLAGVNGQGRGESTIKQSLLNDRRECMCITSNNPVDSDNDGECDAIDLCDAIPNNLIGTPCDDGDNTTVNDVWDSSSCSCQGIVGCIVGDIDSDADGICDKEDLDDDNDGIPDAKESICSFKSLTELSMYGNAITSIADTEILFSSNNAWRSSYSEDIFSLPIHLEFQGNNSNYIMIGLLPVGFAENVLNYQDGSYKLYMHPNNRIYGKLPGIWNFNTAGVNGKKIELDINLKGHVEVTLGGQVIYNGTAPISDYKLAVSSHSGGSTSGVEIRHGSGACTNFDIDTDLDDVPDRLDLDSDGDMCVDAYEGGASFGLNDMDAIGRLTSGVNINQGSATYGIPSIAGNGQEIGESIEAHYPLKESRECMCIASLDPIDSDNDGICDAIDNCDNLSDALIGTPCDDGDICTIDDIWTTCCECVGQFADADGDGTCDAEDNCPDYDNAIDIDDDDIADCIDPCIDVDDNSICDSADPGFIEDKLKTYANRRRGYYYEPFSLQFISNDPGAVIYYTTDGSEPNSNDLVFSGTSILVDSSSYFRVIAINDIDTSKINTFSYLFSEDMIGQEKNVTGFPKDMDLDESITENLFYKSKLDEAIRGIPTVSIVMDTADFNAFYYEKEIQSPVSIELLYPDGTEYQQNGGVESYGNSTFGQLKKNFRFIFKEEFGESKFEYPIFGGDAAEDFDYWVLRAGGQVTTNRGGGQNLNDQFLRDLQLITSGTASHGDFFHVTYNGKYWGVYNAAERPQKSFAESYFGGDKDDWNTMKGTCCDVGLRTTDGDLSTYDSLLNNINDLDAASQYLDIDHFINYVMINNYGPHGDWRTWNTYGVDNPVIGEPIRFYVWDSEPSLASEWYYVTRDTGTVDLNQFYNPLKAQEEFRVRTGDHMECNCFNDGPMTPNKAKELYQSWYDKTILPMLWESARWQDVLTYETFATYKDSAFNHFDQRTDTLVARYKQAGLYPSINAVQFSQYGGQVSSGYNLTLTNLNSSGSIYYTIDGSDPRLEGGGLSSSALLYSGGVVINDVVEINARIKIGNTWSAMCPRVFYGPQNYQDLVINEIHYNPNDSIYFNSLINDLDTISGRNFEFIELKNTGSEAIHLYGTRFSKGIQYEIKEFIVVPADSFVVFAEDEYWFEQKYGIVPDGKYFGKLDNGGEKINYKDPFGNFIDSLRYDDGGDWPGTADKGLYSVALKNPSLDNSDPFSWGIQSVFVTPRAENYFTDFGQHNYSGLVINEIHYNPFDSIDAVTGELIDGRKFEFVELKNISSASIDLSDVLFTRGIQYTFEPGTAIGPGAFIVLAEDKSSFEDRYGFAPFDKYDGRLSDSGEAIWLSKANGVLLDAVTYDEAFPWDPNANGGFADYSLALIDGTVNNDTYLNWQVQCNVLYSPGSENDFSCFQGLDYSGLVINEIHYSPVQGNDHEFIELFNSSNVLLNLDQVSFSTGINYVFDKFFVGPGQSFILARDSVLFANTYGVIPRGQYIGGMSSNGETIVLSDLFGVIIDEVTYGVAAPWNAEPLQGVKSLALTDPMLDNNLAESWCIQQVNISPNSTNNFADTDFDGVIDCDDSCPGFNDNLIGLACDDGDPCTVGETYTSNCNCSGGVGSDSDNDGICDFNDRCPGLNDALIGEPCSDGDICTVGERYNSNCECAGGVAVDSDFDGVCDALDQCPLFNDGVIGLPCNDGDVCTSGERYNTNCQCSDGTFIDTDNDGVCDSNDQCPGSDDNIDNNNNGVPDDCENCENYILENTNAQIVTDRHANINISTNGQVPSPEDIQYTAGQSIDMMEGFEVKVGAVFVAMIDTCN